MVPADAVGWGSAAASLMFLWAVVRDYIPRGLETYIQTLIDKLWSFFFHPYVQITFQEYSGQRMKRSEVYNTIRTYLSATAPEQAKRLVAADAGPKDDHHLALSLDDFEQVTDVFRGIHFHWTSRKKSTARSIVSWYPSQEDPRYYRLTVHLKHRHLVDDYLRHVREQGKAIQVRTRQRKLYTNNPSSNWYGYKKNLWSHTVFEHPATFDTLAMAQGKKEEILRDLDNFTRGKDFYKKIGRAWKRGYLLYGPPGTGKSTMIAAMANHLDYDVYDLELTAVKDNTELRKLLIETTPKSLIVIEDIDCSEDLSGKRKKTEEKDEEEDDDDDEILPRSCSRQEEEKKIGKVTLSGLLNFIDGLWSSCGGERLIVFTTNHVEKLDPALIRRGRMDKHIELSYCCFETFKVLAKNYLGVDSHPLFQTVRELLGESKITPADVAENLMPRCYIAEEAEENVQRCLEVLIEALGKALTEEAALLQAEDNRKALKRAKEEATLETQENGKEKTEEKETVKEEYVKDMSEGIENGVIQTDGI